MSETIAPRRLKRGDTLDESWLNQVAAKIVQRIRFDGADVRRIGPNIVIDYWDRGGGGGSAVKLFKVSVVHNDYLTLESFEGPVTTVEAAKPFKLRHDADNYDQLTSLSTVGVQEVDVEAGSTTETWVVNPRYDPGDHVYTVSVPRTDVFLGQDELRVLDLNVDGRAWAKKFEPAT